MLNCNVCLRRAYTNLPSEISSGSSSHNVILAATSQFEIGRICFAARRSHSTVASIKKGHHRRVLKNYSKKDLSSIPRNKRRAAPDALTKGERKDALARDKNKSWLLTRKPAEENEDEDEDDDEPDTDSQKSRFPPQSRAGQPMHRGVKAPAGKRDSAEESRRAPRYLRSVTGQRETSDEKRLAIRDQNTVENYLKDPLRLADAVLERLKASDIEGALRYVRASEGAAINNIVSWNHCLDWLMAQGEMKESLALYNDMKKRGRRPDAHTYTIMLRGLSAQIQKRGAVEEAVKIYNSMYAPNSAVTPNAIHTNAAINVCARGGDMDALWAITSKMPERGPGSPDRITYTTIFNAIRDNTIRQVAKLAGNDSENTLARRRIFEKAVEDARKVWEDVSYKWRRADMIIDEHLVCAMGRVLHGCGKPRDMPQILDLVESTMNFRVKRKRVESIGNPSLQKPIEPIPEQNSEPKSYSNQEQLPIPTGSDLQSITPMVSAKTMPLSESSTYAKPGPRTLSLLLDVCVASHPLTHLAPDYWHLLTNPNGKYRVAPDAANILAYLRILRINHASQAAYETLAQKWPDRVAKELYRRGPFVVAMRTCNRDRNNPNVFRTAMRIVDLMQQKLEERSVGMFEESRALADMHGGARKKEIARLKQEQKDLTRKELDELAKEDASVQRLPVDPYVLTSLLTLAERTTKGWHEGVRGRDDGEIFERDPKRNHTVIALRRVGSLSTQLKQLMFAKLHEVQHGIDGLGDRTRKDSRFGSRIGEELEDLVMLTRALIRTCSKVNELADRFKQAGRAEIDPKIVDDCKNWTRIYGAYLSRVDKALGQDYFKRRARDEDEVDEEDEHAAEEEDDNIAPLIEQQIRAALGEATTEMIQDRSVQKGRPVRYAGDESVPPKFKSRVMERQYETKVQRAMKARNLDVGTDFGSESPSVGLGGSSQRRPMIGDELDFDDGNNEDLVSSRSQGGRHRQYSDDVPFAADSHGNQRGRPSRILGRPDVKKTWQNASERSLLRAAAAAQ